MIHKAHNRFRTGALLAVLATSTICATSQTTQSSISGVVYGPDGKALGGTRVWANIISPLPRPVDRNSSTIPVLSTITARDGTFALPYVPAGDYVLCASNAAAAALNPCIWGGAPQVKIANGLNATGQAIRMAAGATLLVHLDDPGGLLPAHIGKEGASLIIGLGAPHGFLPLPIVGITATSRDYQILVPSNSSPSLMISTQHFKLTDPAGVSISTPTYTTSVTIASGTPVAVIQLRVAGVN
jgi:hypothetical protein